MGGHCSCAGWTEEVVVVVTRVAVAVVRVLDKRVPPNRHRRSAVVEVAVILKEGRRSREKLPGI